jgi:hypothetical protein
MAGRLGSRCSVPGKSARLVTLLNVCSGSVTFESPSEHRLSGLKFFVICLSPSRQLRGLYLVLDRFLPRPFQFIIHWLLSYLSTLYGLSYWHRNYLRFRGTTVFILHLYLEEGGGMCLLNIGTPPTRPWCHNSMYIQLGRCCMHSYRNVTDVFSFSCELSKEDSCCV